MNISDEKLSAFLDSELPEQEMDSIRLALSQDEQLNDRLAMFASADQSIIEHYSQIDDRPIPASILAMLEEQKPTAQIIEFPLWKRAFKNGQKLLREHAAVAALVSLAIGFSVAQLAPTNDKQNGNWIAVAHSLETTSSDTMFDLDNGNKINPRLSFVNQKNQYCRQFQIIGESEVSENIACKSGSEISSWQLIASIKIDAIKDPNTYQTASGGSLLDSTLDQIISGEALSVEEERELIQKSWNQQILLK